MLRMLTIARRELASFFYSPIAYVVMSVLSVLACFVFFDAFQPGNPAAEVLKRTFAPLLQLSIFLVPALSMRLLSEEIRTGTIEPLLTAPVNDVQVITGKWLGSLGFLIIMLLVPFAMIASLMFAYSNPGPGQLISGLLGLILIGALYLSIGLLASAATQNQIVAWIVAVLIICGLTYLMDYLYMAAWMQKDWRPIPQFANVNYHAGDFAKGIISLSAVLYFAVGIWMFLFLAVKMLESRRWR